MTTADYKRAYQQGYSDAQRDFREKPKTEWHIARGMYEDRFWCSCGYIKIIDSNMNEWKYCPICGAIKIEPQESEDEE